MNVLTYIKTHLSETIRNHTKSEGTLIGLPKPYTVPCADKAFQEMYYWDTYFTNVGLLVCGEEELARNNVEDLLYLADTYGYVPNGSRTYYLRRSQPPYLASAVQDIYRAFADKEWLARAYPILKKEYGFWMRERVDGDGLNRYGCKEEPAWFVQTARDAVKGRLPWQDVSDEVSAGRNICAESESGWVFTARFSRRCTDHEAVDLNSLLFGYERSFAFCERELGLSDGAAWERAAQARKEKMIRMRAENGVWFDYDAKNGVRSPVVSCASFLPYQMGLSDGEGIEYLLSALECEHGIAAADRQPYAYQWGFPNGWAPLHHTAVQALLRVGRRQDAFRIARKFCTLVEENFARTGRLWEKYNVVSGETDTVDEYEMPPMLGWTAGVYCAFYSLLKNNIEIKEY